MNITVFLAGIADPKWPLPPLAVTADDRSVRAADSRRILSPFDEAALEIALKIRDARPETRIAVVVTGGTDMDNVLRSVAAFRPDHLVRLDAEGLYACDAQSLSRQLATAAASLPAQAELVLMGREFGDLDNGTLAPCLAERMECRFAALIQDARWSDTHLALMRERGGAEEWLHLDAPMVASVTNDRRNRLRHPLMKNVMAAKRATFPVIPASAGDDDGLRVTAAAPAQAAPRRSACRMLAGSLEERVDALAGFLAEWKTPQ
ncbi:MAG: electron transfer flavoprotein subunit beta [Pseudomonadota bacterium]